jgi:hypothetical protein
MKPEEREKLEQWTRRMDELETGIGAYPIGAVPHLAGLFPAPDTSGMTPAQAEAVLAKWRTEVNAAIAKGELPPSTPSGVNPPAQLPTKPEAPVA